MIETPHFFWVHVPRTGGTWFRRVVLSMAYGKFWLSSMQDHDPAPEGHSKPLIACVRNPWDWWVSYYCFWLHHYEAGTGGYALPRDEWTENERHNAQILTEARLAFGPFVRLSAAAGVSQTSWADRLGVGAAANLCLARFERLVPDCFAILKALIPASLAYVISKALADNPERVNAGRHRPYAEYYDGDLESFVAGLECRIMNQHHYQFRAA